MFATQNSPGEVLLVPVETEMEVAALSISVFLLASTVESVPVLTMSCHLVQNMVSVVVIGLQCHANFAL